MVLPPAVLLNLRQPARVDAEISCNFESPFDGRSGDVSEERKKEVRRGIFKFTCIR